MSYCEYCLILPLEDIHRVNHNSIYGQKITDDFELFGRFILEIIQAGLCWNTILRWEVHFRKAFDAYKYELIAKYTAFDMNRLRDNPGIIRNRRKIEAVIYYAN